MLTEGMASYRFPVTIANPVTRTSEDLYPSLWLPHAELPDTQFQGFKTQSLANFLLILLILNGSRCFIDFKIQMRHQQKTSTCITRSGKLKRAS